MELRKSDRVFTYADHGWRRVRSVARIMIVLCCTFGIVARPGRAQTPQPGTLEQLNNRILETQDLLAQLKAQTAQTGSGIVLGGQVHGFVVAALGDFVKSNTMYLPDAQVFLRSQRTGANGPKVATNDQGYFVIPTTPSGQYSVCAEAAGFASACDPTPIFITRGTFVLNHNISIRPEQGFVTGQVLLKDGMPCFQENTLFQTFVYAKLELLDASNRPLTPTVRANSLGFYVLPIGQANGAVRLQASCDKGQGSRPLTLAGTHGTLVNLSIDASTPRIVSLTATSTGRMVRTAAPGDTLDVITDAVDPDGSALQYRWAPMWGSAVTGTSATAQWKLPAQGATDYLWVQVTNGNGGYMRKHVSVRTGDRSSVMSGTIIDSFTGGPLAGAAVTVNGKMVQSAPDGSFVTNVPEAERYVINARKTGYGLQSRIVYLPTSDLAITLDRAQRHVCLPDAICSIVAEGRGTLTRVVIPIRGLVDSNGRAATGPVNLDVIGYNISKPNPIPGDFAAVAKNGRGTNLLTYGAASIDATDNAGNRYTLAPGMTAHLAMLVDNTHLTTPPPASVPLWEYSEQTGLWMERATATFNTATRSYEGDIPAFSAWNADATFSDTACIAITVPDLGGPPLPFVLHALPTSQNNFQHTVFTVTDSLFPIYRLLPNTDVDIELHANVTPDPGAFATFHLNSGDALNPQPPPDGVPLNPTADCKGIDKATGKAPVLLLPRLQTFLSILGTPPSDGETTNYWKTVGALDASGAPTASRGTLNQWLTTNGFSTDPKNPAPGEVAAVYFNNGDLEFGRDMHCLTKNGKSACYVTNYGQLQGDSQAAIHDALNKVNPVATVAMEYDPALNDFAVRFYAYQADGKLFPNPALDSQGKKNLPQNCMACHGGAYDAGAHNASNSAFLPFDIAPPNFLYDQTPGSTAAQGAQNDKFRALNAIVRSTNPNGNNLDAPITGLIDGWYAACGGVNTPGCNTADETFVPGGWKGQSANSDALYQTIPRIYCRTCHVAQGSATTGYPDFTAYSDFNSPGFVGSVVCSGKIMPHAEVPWKKFWFSTSPYAPGFLADATTGINISGGCPP